MMEEQSKLAERILDQVADAVICINHSGAIIRWNPACTALFGFSAEEALGQSVDLIIPEHLRAALGAASTLRSQRARRSSRPPDTHPCPAQERTQGVCRDDICGYQRRHRKRSIWLGLDGARPIARELNEREVPTPSGGPWYATTVIRVQRRLKGV